MMYCPTCRREYGKGAEQCLDCKVPLVSDVSPEQVKESGNVDPQFKGDSFGASAALAAVWNAGMEYREEEGGGFLGDGSKQTTKSGIVVTHSDGAVQICLPSLATDADHFDVLEGLLQIAGKYAPANLNVDFSSNRITCLFVSILWEFGREAHGIGCKVRLWDMAQRGSHFCGPLAY